MQTKFSPGPWEYSNTMGGGKKILIPPKLIEGQDALAAFKIAQLTDYPIKSLDEQQHANGKLMAAAPDLYISLKELVLLHKFPSFPLRHKIYIERAEKALLKATEG